MRTQIPGRQILDLDLDTNDIKNGAITDLKLSTTGVTAGNYTKLTVNAQGRITSALNPTTLAGYNITDAVPMSLTSSTNTVGSIPVRDANGSFVVTSIIGSLTGNAQTASKFLVPRTINGVAFDGSSNISLPGLTGDILSTPGTFVTSINNSVTAGTYDQVVVNSKGLVTGGVVKTNKVAQMMGSTIPPSTGTTTIIPATAAPTTSMGTLVFSQDIIPTTITSTICIDLSGMVDCTAIGVYVAVFRNSAFIAAGFVSTRINVAGIGLLGGANNLSLKVLDVPGVTSACTYTVRIGASAVGTWYFGRDVSNSLGGQNKSSITFTEML